VNPVESFVRKLISELEVLGYAPPFYQTSLQAPRLQLKIPLPIRLATCTTHTASTHEHELSKFQNAQVCTCDSVFRDPARSLIRLKFFITPLGTILHPLDHRTCALSHWKHCGVLQESECWGPQLKCRHYVAWSVRCVHSTLCVSSIASGVH
jgi:hypothetical protein